MKIDVKKTMLDPMMVFKEPKEVVANHELNRTHAFDHSKPPQGE